MVDMTARRSSRSLLRKRSRPRGPKDKRADDATSSSLSTISTATSSRPPGTIQVGCCIRTRPRSGPHRRRRRRVLRDALKGASHGQPEHDFGRRGDLIGASPLISGLFHDEPAIHSLNALGLDFSGVGNHEFDEGIAGALPHAVRRLPPGDHCAGEPFTGAIFRYLAANVVQEGTARRSSRPTRSGRSTTRRSRSSA